MKYLSASLRLCAICLATNLASADEPFVWKWAEGDTTRYLMTQSMEMTMDGGPAGQISTSSETQTLMRWTVEAPAEETDAVRLNQQVERVVMESVAPAGQGYTYDSDSEDPPVGMAALAAPMFQAMIANGYTVTMRPSGEITSVELSEELAQAFDRLPGRALSAEMVKQMAKQAAMAFPNEPLVLNDNWTTVNQIEAPLVGPMEIATTYTYKGPRWAEGRELEVFTPKVELKALGAEGLDAKVAIENKSTEGEILFDAELGRLVSSDVTQAMDVTVQVAGREVVNEVVQRIALRALADEETPSMGVDDGSLEPAAAE